MDYARIIQFSNNTDIFTIELIFIRIAFTVKVQSRNRVSLSVKCAFVTIIAIANRRPVSPTCILCAVTACHIALIYHNVCGEDGVQTHFPIGHLLCKPIQLTGIGYLVSTVAVAILCRLVWRSTAIVITKTVYIITFLRTRSNLPPDILQSAAREIQQRSRCHDRCRRKGSQPFPLFLHNMPPFCLRCVTHLRYLYYITPVRLVSRKSQTFGRDYTTNHNISAFSINGQKKQGTDG